MIDIDSIRFELQDRRIGLIADKTGLSTRTITNIRDGVGSPTYRTLKKLSDYFDERDHSNTAQ